MPNLNIAVIGCGRMGKMHITHIKRYFPEIHVKSVVDTSPDVTWLTRHGISEVHTQLSPVLEDKQIDAVIIATSSSEHVGLIELFASAKKNIFCEKPIAFSLEGVQKAISAVKIHQVKMQVGFNRRFDPSFIKIRETVQNGELGKLYSVRITNRDPRRPNLEFIPRSGGLFLDFHVHDFDMLRYVTKQEIETIQAFGSNLVDSEIGKLGDIDTSIISCTLKGGGVASIDASREAVYGYDQRVEVLGSLGSIEAENQRANTLRVYQSDKIYTDPLKTSFIERYEEAYCNQMQAFFDYLSIDDAASPVDGYDTLQAVACAIAADRSMREERAVNLLEIL